MSANPEFIEYVRELFIPLGSLKGDRFFGGFSFKYHSSQFAMIMGNTLYFCVNDQTRIKYETNGMKPFSYSTKKGQVQVKKYYSVPAEVLENHDELLAWEKEAIQSAQNY